MKKIVLAIFFTVTLILNATVIVFAAPFDLTYSADNTKNYTFNQFIDSPSVFDFVASNLAGYEIEGLDGVKYSAQEINNRTMLGMNFVQAVASIKATAAVTTAEGSLLQADVDIAQALITALPNGTDKTALQNRLNIVIALIPVVPPAPAVTNNDVANTVSGMATGMEYKLDSAGYVAYVAGTFNLIDFSGNHTLLVRVAAEGINPPSQDTTLTFTINPVTPAAPTVSRDDTTNTVSGMSTGMEYNLDNAGYVAYVAGTFNAIDFSGNHTLLVRVAAEGINPPSLDTTLTFTTNPPTLVSIAITTPATKTTYGVGQTLSITGLVVTGTYDDNSTAIVPILAGNISGFNSTVPVLGQTLTITVDGKTTTYDINILQVILSKTTTSMFLGSSETLSVTVLPVELINKNVIWTVASNENAATVSNGFVTGVNLGIATVRATTEDGGIQAECFVTVINGANVLNNFNLANTTNTMSTLITQFGDALGMNLTTYNTLSAGQKTNIQNIMIDTPFATFENIRDVFNQSLVSEILANINNQVVNVNTIGIELANNAQRLGLDLSAYNALTLSEEKAIVHGKLLLPVHLGIYYSTTADLQAVLDLAVTNVSEAVIALAEVNAATTDALSTTLVNNAVLLGLSLDSYNLYVDQQTINTSLEPIVFTNSLDLQREIDFILGNLTSPFLDPFIMADMTTIASIITDNAVGLGLNLTVYDSLTLEEQEFVHGYLLLEISIQGGYFSLAAIHVDFNTAVANASAAQIALAEINAATVDAIDEALINNASLLGLDMLGYDPVTMNAILEPQVFTNTYDLQFAIYGW